MNESKIAILGGGNIGLAIMNGLTESKIYSPQNISITRKNIEPLLYLKKQKINVTSDNISSVKKSSIILIAVQPQQINGILDEIKGYIKPNIHTVISVVSGATISAIKKRLPAGTAVVRAMPNTAIALKESMTCLSSEGGNDKALKHAVEIFNAVGKKMIINDELMIPETAL